MRGSGARAVVEALKTLGVTRVFGLPAIQNMELFDEFLDAPFETLLVTNETSAAFMADVHGRVTGELGVLCVSPGPGITNCITALAEALLDSSPVLGIVASPSAVDGRAFRLHNIAQMDVIQPVVKGVFTAKTVQEIPDMLIQGARLALDGEPGPVIVEIPTHLLIATGDFSTPTPARTSLGNNIDAQLDSAVGLLKRSQRLGIYAGLGATKAASQVMALADLLGAPVATTISGRGVIPEDHPLSVGVGFGTSGTAIARKVFGQIDTLLAIGCKYGETATGSHSMKVPKNHIHIDICRNSLDRNYATSLAIEADAETALKGLVSRLQGFSRMADLALLQEIGLAKENEVAAVTSIRSDRSVSPPKLLRTMRQVLDRDALLVTDCGNHQFWAVSDFPVYVPRSFITPADYQAMGFSIPGAIAAKLATPQRQVVSLVGDGGFLMSGFELLTAVRKNIKVMVVLFRDGALGMIKDAQAAACGRTGYITLQNPDFRSVAQALGLEYVPISCDDDIPAALDRMLKADRSILVDANVEYTERTRYFKGAALAMFRRLPFDAQVRLCFRLIRRKLLQKRGH